VARPERLRALLHALAGEDVVVVANGATSEVQDVIAAAGVRCVRLEPNRGPAAARNAGWRACDGEYVAFTDDDCLPAPGWLAALRTQAAPGVVVQGRVAPLPEEAHRVGPFARTVIVDAQGPFFHTANVLYPRALLEAVGGFDESYARVAGEDTDLGWRAMEAGAQVRFAPDALVWHAVTELGWRGLARDAARWGTAVRLVKRHPGLRAHFHHRIFWKRSH
jgi:GT2 family glycosyltransferase